MKKLFENKIFKSILFVSSAIILALLLSLFIKNNGQKYETDGSTTIENQKDALIIGNQSLEDLSTKLETSKPIENVPSPTEKPSTSFQEPEKDNSYANINTVTPILKEENKKPSKQEPLNKEENTKKENTPIEITPEALENIAQTGISETDLYFLRDIVYITDEIVSDYTETLSFALDGNFAKGELNIANLENDLEKLKKLETKDKTLQSVKESLINGTTKYIEGFKDYFSYGNKSTELFKKADEYFYQAQSSLQLFLEAYK